MTDKNLTDVTDNNVGKMSDNEIKKALECCSTYKGKCTDCPAFVKVDRSNCKKVLLGALDIINRIQALNKDLAETTHNLILEKDALFDKAEELKAEVERLKRELDLVIENSISARYPHCVLCGNGAILTKSLEEYDELIANISAEAYKEFAERLKEKSFQSFGNYGITRDVVEVCDIDNIVKEMVGEANARNIV